MLVSAKLGFSTRMLDIKNLVYNAKISHCHFYDSILFKKKLVVEDAIQFLLQQVENKGDGFLYALKDNIPFKISINWENEIISLEMLSSETIIGLKFYLFCMLEICNNFIIYEIEAKTG